MWTVMQNIDTKICLVLCVLSSVFPFSVIVNSRLSCKPFMNVVEKSVRIKSIVSRVHLRCYFYFLPYLSIPLSENVCHIRLTLKYILYFQCYYEIYSRFDIFCLVTRLRKTEVFFQFIYTFTYFHLWFIISKRISCWRRRVPVYHSWMCGYLDKYESL